jgi:hypothetical protein
MPVLQIFSYIPEINFQHWGRLYRYISRDYIGHDHDYGYYRYCAFHHLSYHHYSYHVWILVMEHVVENLAAANLAVAYSHPTRTQKLNYRWSRCYANVDKYDTSS